jgi:predicted N-acetyltransferase YhbS
VLNIRLAAPNELGAVRSLYASWGYGGGVAAEDAVFVAEQAGEIIGMVRRTIEMEVMMLRGMQVAPAERGKGVGTALLKEFVEQLGGRECFCVPYSHLLDFYGGSGFVLVQDNAPPFLVERVARYRERGLQVELMRRPAG